MSNINLTTGGPPETVLDQEPSEALTGLAEAMARPEGERRDAVAAVVAAHPRFLDGWARLGDLARDPVEAYAAYRVGYHRGLDRLRQNGWRGSGYVRWIHEPNRGFLRALDGLRRMAAEIGEVDERDRCAVFLQQLDPEWNPALIDRLTPDRPDDRTFGPVVGAVLCGGRSSRFGSDKALAPFRSSTVGGHVVGALRSAGIDPVAAIGGSAGPALGIPDGRGSAAGRRAPRRPGHRVAVGPQRLGPRRALRPAAPGVDPCRGSAGPRPGRGGAPHRGHRRWPADDVVDAVAGIARSPGPRPALTTAIAGSVRPSTGWPGEASRYRPRP